MGQFSPKELNFILGQFSIAPKKYSLTPLNQGYINDTFVVWNQSVPVYLLQRINHEVFPDVEGLMGNISRSLQFLASNSYEPISLVPTATGHFFFTHTQKGQSYWRLFTFMNHSVAHDTTGNPKVAFGAGRIIAEFHTLLQRARPEDFVEVIPGFHDLGLREKQFAAAISMGIPKRLTKAKASLEFALKTMKILKERNTTDLPYRVCHNDTKLNNILFSRETDLPLCLIDLDTLMKGFFQYDFGDAVRTIVNTALEDETDLDKIGFNKDLFKAFVQGLAAAPPFLTRPEIHSLPWGAVLMPFLHGIRALTDYLNGDLYYKTSYESQNLDRSLSLFQFTSKAMDNLSFMENSVLHEMKSISFK